MRKLNESMGTSSITPLSTNTYGKLLSVSDTQTGLQCLFVGNSVAVSAHHSRVTVHVVQETTIFRVEPAQSCVVDVGATLNIIFSSGI